MIKYFLTPFFLLIPLSLQAGKLDIGEDVPPDAIGGIFQIFIKGAPIAIGRDIINYHKPINGINIRSIMIADGIFKVIAKVHKTCPWENPWAEFTVKKICEIKESKCFWIVDHQYDCLVI